MKRKKKLTKKKTSIMLLVVILITAVAVYYWYWQQNDDSSQWLNTGLPEIKSTRTQNLKKTKSDIIDFLESARQAGKYGSWPIKNINLSVSRGNPFQEKQLDILIDTNLNR